MVGRVYAADADTVSQWVKYDNIDVMETEGGRKELTELFQTASYAEGTVTAEQLLSSIGHAVKQKTETEEDV